MADTIGTDEDKRRFWSRVDISDECWEWTAGKDWDGYGAFKLWVGDKRVQYRTHRLSYMWNIGPIPEGMLVCHHCDNPPCVRPDHLFLGTQADNSHDRDRKGRGADNLGSGPNHILARHPELRPRGEQVGTAKLSAADVLEIRRLHAAGVTPTELGRRYGVHKNHIGRLVRRERWAHI